MPIPSAKDPRLLDGSIWITRGTNSGVVPDGVPRDQLSFAVNTSTRNNRPSNRPGIKKVSLSFDSTTSDQTNFEDNLFQGAGTYVWTGASYILTSIGGRIFVINCSDFTVSDISIPTDLNPSVRDQAWFEQAEMFGVIQDGQSRPLIFNGSVLRRAGVDEVPAGTLMKYALGRLTVVLPDERSFMAGNLVGRTDTGTAPYRFRDSLLKFTDNSFLSSGGVFSAPQKITALQELATLDTTLNQGPLQVFTTGGAYSVNYPFTDDWFIVQYPLVTGSLLSNGPAGPYATVNINNDIWFRSLDGIRSLRVSRRQFEGWGDTPLSREVERVLKFDTRQFLHRASAVFFDNRLLMTASPRFVPGKGYVHYGIVPLDFDETSSIARDGIPAWDCLWTGVRVLQVLTLKVNDVDRCFYLALDANDKISLYEQSISDPADNYGETTEQRIPWFYETSRYVWGERDISQRRYKKLVAGDISVSNLQGTVDFTVRFRADNYPPWTLWHNWTECATQECAPIFCEDPNVGQAREPMRLPEPDDVCEAYAGANAGKGTPKMTRYGYAFQTRVEVTGAAQIESLRLAALPEAEPRYDACKATEPCLSLQDCNEATFNHTVT